MTDDSELQWTVGKNHDSTLHFWSNQTKESKSWTKSRTRTYA